MRSLKKSPQRKASPPSTISIAHIDQSARRAPASPQRAGLTPLAEAWTAGASAAALAEQAESLAQASDELADAEAAVAGACDILAEALADDAEMRARLREELAAKGVIHTKAGKTPDPTYDNYLDYSEPAGKNGGASRARWLGVLSARMRWR